MISITIRFWSYLILLVPSILCTLFVLYHLLFDRTLRHTLSNHVIILLLIISLISQLTIYPWMLYFYNYDDIWERSPFFCTLWGFLDWGLYVTQTILFAWVTIERHILIFHDHWVSTRIKRLFVHYLPPVLLLLYCLLFYVIIDFFPPCDNLYFDYDMICVFFCALYNYELSMWETIVHQLLPVFIIVLSSIILLLRTLYHRYRVRRPIQWRRYRKMTIQMLAISFLYLIFSFPFALVTILYLLGWAYDVYGCMLPYANFFTYLFVLLFPFVSLFSLPALRRRITNLLYLYRWLTRTIHPRLAFVRPIVNNRVHVQ